MSDTEKTDASPQKEEVKEESNMVEEKPNENERDEEKMEAEVDEEEKEVQQDEKAEETTEEVKMEEQESKPESEESTPKKTPRKKKKVEKREDEEEEELPLGLLERPVVIESGKREKRKVERLSMTMTLYPGQKKKVDIQEGAGAKLGECPRIEYKISHMKADDLKTLHRILFGKKGSQIEVKRNLRQFNGFGFTKEDKEYKQRLTSVGKLTLPVLKSYCELLDLEKSGVKDEVVQRIMDFLMHPVDSGKQVPEPKKRGRASKGEKKSKGVKRKRGEKKEGKKKKKTSKEDVESDDDDDDNDDDDDDKDVEENDNDEGDEDGDVDEASEEEAPKKKKAKVESKKSKKDSEDKKEKNEKKEKKEKSAKKEKKEPKKKKVEISSDDDDDDDEDDEVLKKSGPPNNDELRDVVKKILDGANLEEVTMKTVVKQVYAKYPDFDLTDKKEFIKNTVKQLIS